MEHPKQPQSDDYLKQLEERFKRESPDLVERARVFGEEAETGSENTQLRLGWLIREVAQAAGIADSDEYERTVKETFILLNTLEQGRRNGSLSDDQLNRSYRGQLEKVRSTFERIGVSRELMNDEAFQKWLQSKKESQ